MQAKENQPDQPRRWVRLTTAGHGSRPVPGLDFSDNAAVRAAMDEYQRRQMTVGDH